MKYRNTQAARRMLSDLASTQGGYFTAKQAAGIGYGKRHLDYHVKAGNIERAGHGLYRLPTIPLSEHDDLIRLSLWSRNRHDEPQAVASHESALGVHGLGELLPSLIHVTVPPTFRKDAPNGCTLHRARLTLDEVEQREGFIKAAIEATFRTRHTHPIPERLPPPPDSWDAEFAALAKEANLSTHTLAEGVDRLTRYWDAHQLNRSFP